jgi:ketosteroid isomerase-like protein
MNKAFQNVIFVAGLLAIGLTACSAPAADSRRVALEAAIQRWITAVNARDAATLSTTMTVDVELLEGDAAIAGRDAAIRALSDSATRGKLATTSRELTMADDIAWRVVGLARTQSNGDVQALGQALEIWKRVDGQWRLHRRMTASAIEPGASLTRPSTKEPVLDQPGN